MIWNYLWLPLGFVLIEVVRRRYVFPRTGYAKISLSTVEIISIFGVLLAGTAMLSVLIALIAGSMGHLVEGNWREIISYALIGVLVMAFCFTVVGANHGLAFFSSAYYSLANPAHKHRRASINEGAVGLGGFAGSMIFGYVVGHYAFALPFYWTPVFVGLALGVQAWLLHYGRVRVEREEAEQEKHT